MLIVTGVDGHDVAVYSTNRCSCASRRARSSTR
jgi:hypothetical protein